MFTWLPQKRSHKIHDTPFNNVDHRAIDFVELNDSIHNDEDYGDIDVQYNDGGDDVVFKMTKKKGAHKIQHIVVDINHYCSKYRYLQNCRRAYKQNTS